MSGIKDPHVTAFLRALRARGLSAEGLAAQARIGRCHFAGMLYGHRTGAHSWKHVMPLLLADEVFHLKQCSAWNSHAEAAWNAEVSARSPGRFASAGLM
jgi:hypothetical protein